MDHKYFLNSLLIVFAFQASLMLGQKDTLTPLSYNPYILDKKTDHSNQKTMDASDTLYLPFYDDFSEGGPYPSTDRWVNSNSVYVNNNFAKNPKNIGVATFDGLMSNGYAYKPYGSSSVANSDTLTSKYIRLDQTPQQFSITPADSVYFSFYYEPRGFGHYPLSTHTLILDFYNPVTQTWSTQLTLSRSGNSVYQPGDTTFKRVMIPITNPDYFHADFRFRFRNKSSGVGCVNHWHIDDIYLAKDRNITDTISHDLAFVYEAPTFLEKYTALPYEQYLDNSLMASHTYLNIRNNDIDGAASNFTGYLEIKDNSGNVVLYDTTGSANAPSFYPYGYVSNADIIDPINSTVSPQISSFAFNNGNSLTDSITYFIKHYFLSPAADISHSNDTIVYKQRFHNYYAYDDGTAELAYGLQDPDYFGAQTAVQYQLYKTDTLQAIDIFFNPVPSPGGTIDQQNYLTFGLRVWNDAGGVPGTAIYNDNNSAVRNPEYLKWGPNNYFVRYFLDYPLTMSAGTFYVGVQQDGQPSLNIGFDQNTNTQSKLFYNVGTWTNSSYKGTLMIRPVFGDSIWAATGVKSIKEQATKTIIYPNPANDKLFIVSNMSTENNELLLELYNTLGQVVLREAIQSGNSLSVATLEQGVYFACITSKGKIIDTQKVIISR